MSLKVLDVGNCGPDHSAIRSLIESNFDATVVQTHGTSDTLKLLRDLQIQLVLVNRLLDRDQSDGLDVIRSIKADAQFGKVPVMMITNYAEHQQSAVAAGAVTGFGKLQLGDPQTIDKLRAYLAR